MFLLTKRLYKLIIFLLIAIAFSSAFVGAHSVQSIDDLAYAVAIRF